MGGFELLIIVLAGLALAVVGAVWAGASLALAVSGDARHVPLSVAADAASRLPANAPAIGLDHAHTHVVYRTNDLLLDLDVMQVRMVAQALFNVPADVLFVLHAAKDAAVDGSRRADTNAQPCRIAVVVPPQAERVKRTGRIDAPRRVIGEQLARGLAARTIILVQRRIDLLEVGTGEREGIAGCCASRRRRGVRKAQIAPKGSDVHTNRGNCRS